MFNNIKYINADAITWSTDHSWDDFESEDTHYSNV